VDAFDSTFLTLLFVPNAKSSVARAAERVNDLIGRIHGSGDQIVIPTPAFAELLTGVGKARKEVFDKISKNPKFILASFDPRAAFELSLMDESIRKATGKKRGDSTATWAKVKFDRQIVAIAKVYGVQTIYSEDEDIHALGKREGLDVKGIADLPLPVTPHSGPGLFD
jgi:predicted nucleic acid-binding protein